MKKFTLLTCFCSLLYPAFSQTPFTITQDNYPIFAPETFREFASPASAGLTPQANGVWDQSAHQGGDLIPVNYYEELDPFYTNAGIDVYNNDFKSLNAIVGYRVYNEFDFNDSGVEDKGIYLDPQAYGLGAYTGNSQDSMKFPLQGYVYPQGRKVISFPATFQSSWQSQTRRVINFSLKIAALGLNNAPCQHVFTIFRTDSIAGWGKMRVYADGAPSIEYDVLINRINQYAVDSFFVNGALAPVPLLNAFSITQGQHTDQIYRYTVYREGYSRPLSILLYNNSTFTTPANVYFDTEDLTPTTAVESPESVFTTLLFPNPASTGRLTLQFAGNIPGLGDYTVVDMQGKTVQRGNAVLENGALNLNLNNQLPNGNYMLNVLNDKKQTLITENFVLAR